VRDPLTGLLNRRAFTERIAQEIDRTRRYERDFSLIMMDLDHFKANQRHVGARRRRRGAQLGRTTALRLDADLAVAHFNLSRLFEEEGQRPDSLQHLAEYKRLIERGGLGA